MPPFAAKSTRSDIHLRGPQGDMQMASQLEKPCIRTGKLPDTPGYLGCIQESAVTWARILLVPFWEASLLKCQLYIKLNIVWILSWCHFLLMSHLGVSSCWGEKKPNAITLIINFLAQGNQLICFVFCFLPIQIKRFFSICNHEGILRVLKQSNLN